MRYFSSNFLKHTRKRELFIFLQLSEKSVKIKPIIIFQNDSLHLKCLKLAAKSKGNSVDDYFSLFYFLVVDILYELVVITLVMHSVVMQILHCIDKS
jgi:hypothetical protein